MTKKAIRVGLVSLTLLVLIFSSLAVFASGFSEKDTKCLSDNVYYEARGISIKEQIMIIDVVLNRIDSGKFPSSICGVIYQIKPVRQFSWTHNPYPIEEHDSYREIQSLVQRILNERLVSTNRSTKALFFERKALQCDDKKICHSFR
jgi:hypothetical protein